MFSIAEAGRRQDALAGEGGAVRRVRGTKMRTTAALFDEVAAVLQFPPYFGENWAAFDECLSDLDWLDLSRGITVAVTDPLEVLADCADLAIFVQVCQSAQITLGRRIESGEWWDRPAVRFDIVLLASPGSRADVRSRWADAGAAFAV